MKKILAAILVLLLIIYFAGPSPSTPEYNTDLPNLPSTGLAVETYVQAEEQSHKIKPGNEASIVWADPVTRAKTPVAIVYLHGFTASQMEGFPTHRLFAERYGCNLYLPRLQEHGIDTSEALLNYTADGVWRSAVEAYAIGRNIGDEVIIMSTSTGGTLALKLAATFPEIKGLINFSPNIEINDPAAFLLNDPWGLQLARIVFKGNYRTLDTDENYKKYWYHQYRLESVTELQELVESICRKATYRDVHCPVFNGYYYRDEEHQDEVVRVSAIQRMHKQLATPDSLKVEMAFPTAGNHVIASDMQSGAFVEVFEAICQFAEEKLGMQPVIK
jgi:esterase/lipase